MVTTAQILLYLYISQRIRDGFGGKPSAGAAAAVGVLGMEAITEPLLYYDDEADVEQRRRGKEGEEEEQLSTAVVADWVC